MPINEWLLSCDFLGRTQKFTISKKNAFQTYFGSILSLIIITIVSYFVIYFGLQIIQKKQPKINSSLYNDLNPQKTSLTSDNFAFTLSLQNPDYSFYINDSIYSVNASIITIMNDGENSETFITPLEIIRCNEYNFTVVPEYFNLLDLENLFCLNMSTEIYLKGDFGQSEWTYLNFEFSKCVNSSKNNNSCSSQEEIDSRLDGGYVGIFMTDLNIVPNNFNNPSQLYGKNIFTTFSAREYIELWVYFKRVELNTDDGLLLNSNKQKSFFNFDTYRETKYYKTSDTFLSVKMRMSLSRNVYDRSYEKVQTVAADIGGIMKLCLFLGEVIVYYFREILYKDYLVSYFVNYSQYETTGNTNENSSANKLFHPNSKINSLWINREKQQNTMVLSVKSKKSVKKRVVNPVNINSNCGNLPSNCSTPKNSSKSVRTFTFLHKNKQRIKCRSLLGYCLFYKKVRVAISSLMAKFHRISFCFDVITYLKMKNEINLLNKKVFGEKAAIYLYNFELPSIKECESFNHYGKRQYYYSPK